MIYEKLTVSLVGLYYFYIVGIGLYMFRTRVAAVKGGQVKGAYFKTYQGDVDDTLKAVGNHYNNQFEAPLVFMITVVVGLILKSVSWAFFAISLLFVLSRIQHSMIHLKSNHPLKRAKAYFGGLICLGCLWLLILADLWIFKT